MPAIEIIRTLVDYNEALDRRMWACIMELNDAQFVEESPYSHGSIRNQVVHAAVIIERWTRGLRGQPDARAYRVNPADFPTRESAQELWESAARNLRQFVSGLDETALERKPEGMDEPAWQVLVHLVNHGTDHRAQILRALYDLGAPTFDQDLIMYLWTR